MEQLNSKAGEIIPIEPSNPIRPLASRVLNVNLTMQPGCVLVADDTTDYSNIINDLENHVAVEFLTYKDDTNPLPESIKRYNASTGENYMMWGSRNPIQPNFILPADGTYSYYKMLIPTLDHFEKSDVVISGNSYPYKISNNELFFHEYKLYKTVDVDPDRNYIAPLQIIVKSVEITDYLEAYNLIMNLRGGSQSFYCPKHIIFSVCKLQRCLVSLQKQLLLSNSGTCGYEKCDTDETLRNHRDFLLSALYVFDYLKDMQNYTEAQRILDNLSSCNSVCGDELNGFNNGCGCGHSI